LFFVISTPPGGANTYGIGGKKRKRKRGVKILGERTLASSKEEGADIAAFDLGRREYFVLPSLAGKEPVISHVE